MGAGRLEDVPSSKSQLIPVAPGGDENVTLTSGAHPVVGLAVICACNFMEENSRNRRKIQMPGLKFIKPEIGQ
jgi:hypothetical protein